MRHGVDVGFVSEKQRHKFQTTRTPVFDRGKECTVSAQLLQVEIGPPPNEKPRTRNGGPHTSDKQWGVPIFDLAINVGLASE